MSCPAKILVVFLVMLLVACSNPQTLGDRFEGVPSDVTPAQLLKQVQVWQAGRAAVEYYEHVNIRSPVRSARMLREQGFRVRSHAPFPVKPPVDWAADPYEDRNWRYQLNAIYPAITYLQAYRESSDKVWFDATVQLYLDWIDFNLSRKLPNEFKWYDMATGIRAINLAYMIDHGVREGLLEANTFAVLADAADHHVHELENQRLTRSNHGLFQVAGIAAICRALPKLERCEDAIPYANAGFVQLFDRQFNAEGMHLEHSPDYHAFALSTLRQMAEAGFFDLEPRHLQTLQSAIANYHWLVKPDLSNPAVGDTSRSVNKALRRLHPTLEYMFSDGERGTRPPGGIRIFGKTGYAFMRHYPSPAAVHAAGYLMMSVAHHSNVHKHSDPFTFGWFDAGRSVLVDSGKWGYDYTEERDYVLSTRAHNSVEIDDQNDEIEYAPDRLPEMSGTFSNDGIYALMAIGERRPSGVEQRRILLTRPGKWLLVADRLAHDQPHRWVQWFHIAEGFRCTSGDDKAFACSAPNIDLRVQALIPVDGVEQERGAREPRMQGWVSPGYGKLVPADAIGFSQTDAKTGRFLTLFSLDRDAVAEIGLTELSERTLTACWRSNGSIDGAVVTWVDGELSVTTCSANAISSMQAL